MPHDPPLPPAARRARLKVTALMLATVLIVGGVIVLFALKRMPLPLRIIVGLGDVFAGLVLLVLLRQVLARPSPKN